jgi:hypothetical protein
MKTMMSNKIVVGRLFLAELRLLEILQDTAAVLKPLQIEMGRK